MLATAWALGLVIFLAALIPPFRRITLPRWVAPVLSALLVAGYIAVFAVLSVQRHDSLHSDAYDLAIFDQAIWNTSQGRLYSVSIKMDDLERPILLGDHFSPAVAVLAPIYWVWNDDRALLIVQTVLLAAGAWPVYRLARTRLPGSFAAPALVAGYLLSPTLHFTNLYDFHEVALAVPALAFAAAALVERRLLPLAIWLGIGLLCKEEIAFAGAAAGLVLAGRAIGDRLRGGKRWLAALLAGIGITAVCTAWAVIVLGWAIPFAEGSGSYTYVNRYEGLGNTPAEIALTMLQQPGLVATRLLEPVKIQFAVSFLAPFALLPLLAPELLVLTLPTFGYLLLSTYAAQYSLGRQYGVFLIPIVAVAAVVGWQRLARLSGRLRGPAQTGLFAAAVAAAIGTYLVFSPGPFAAAYDPVRYAQNPRARYAEDLFGRIPANASVSAQENLAPHLSHRQQLYLFPALHDAEYIAIDNDGGTFPVGRPDWEREVQDLLANPRYTLAWQDHGFALFQRNDGLPGTPVNVAFGPNLKLASFDTARRQGTTEIGLYWQVTGRRDPREAPDGYRQTLRLLRRDGSVAVEIVRPPRAGSGFFETGRGVNGEVIRERYVLPAGLGAGPFKLDVQAVPEPDGAPLPATGDLPEVMLPIGS